MMKFLAYLIAYLLYPFSFLFIRNRKKLAFGSSHKAFNDNAKYLFIHVQSHDPELDSAWISMSKATVKAIRSKGMKAYHTFSIRGVWHALTSKYWVYNAYSSDIMYCLSGGAVLVNLWHGLPLKRIEFGIETGPLADRFVKKTLKERYFHPESFQRPDYVLSSTECISETFARAFRIAQQQCLEVGYPRNEALGFSEKQLLDFIDRYEPQETNDLVGKLRGKGFSKVFVYMPTWRDSQRDLFVQGFDLERMDAVMRKSNALLLLKPHPNMNADLAAFHHYANLALVKADIDMYPVLPFTDVLITDYSSVMYDYLLMKKDVILYLYDYEEYAKERDFFFPFDDYVVGRKVYAFDDLCDMVEQGDYAIDERERERILQLFWGATATGSASQRIKTALWSHSS